MKNLLKNVSLFILMICLSMALVSCGKSSGNSNQNGNGGTAEKVSFEKATLKEVEFEPSEGSKIKQEGSTVTVSGTIDAMSESQKIAFGKEGITHVVPLKFTFDKERTISKFEIKGDEIKVYSDSKDVENYVGSITELLDSEAGEDSYCYLILSAKTDCYKLISTYTDGTESTIELKIVATLATATAE